MNNHKYRILLVEDDASLNKLYTDLLIGEGYSVDIVLDGSDALEKAKTGGYDLILLDLVLPKLDGLSILKELLAHPPKVANKQIIILTNLGQESVLNEVSKFGAKEYLIKSDLTPGEFLERVQSSLK